MRNGGEEGRGLRAESLARQRHFKSSLRQENALIGFQLALAPMADPSILPEPRRLSSGHRAFGVSYFPTKYMHERPPTPGQAYPGLDRGSYFVQPSVIRSTSQLAPFVLLTRGKVGIPHELYLRHVIALRPDIGPSLSRILLPFSSSFFPTVF